MTSLYQRDLQAQERARDQFGSCALEACILWRDFYELLNGGFRLYHRLREEPLCLPQPSEHGEAFVTTNCVVVSRPAP